jgi:HAD superfamily hydrolase (TIGR01457 family)
MDGVLYRGAEPIPHAREFIERLQQRAIPFLLLTNHSCFTPSQLQQKLKRMGIEIPVECFYSSALATAEWLRAQGAQRVFAVGEAGLAHALEANGIEVREADVAHVVVGLDRELSYGKLKHAMRLIAAGARFIGTNPDPTYPVEDGDAPECGLLLGALQTATGIAPTIIGKPEATIYRQAARRLNVPLKNLTMVGDRLDTDIAGALGVGARGVLVLTGHTTRAMLHDSPLQPHEVLENLSTLER